MFQKVRKDDERFFVTEHHMSWTEGFELELDSNDLQRYRHELICDIVLLIFMSINFQHHQEFSTSLHQFTTDICVDRRMNLSMRHFRMHIVNSHMFFISWERRSIHCEILLSLLKIKQNSAAFCVSSKRTYLSTQRSIQFFIMSWSLKLSTKMLSNRHFEDFRSWSLFFSSSVDDLTNYQTTLHFRFYDLRQYNFHSKFQTSDHLVFFIDSEDYLVFALDHSWSRRLTHYQTIVNFSQSCVHEIRIFNFLDTRNNLLIHIWTRHHIEHRSIERKIKTRLRFKEVDARVRLHHASEKSLTQFD